MIKICFAIASFATALAAHGTPFIFSSGPIRIPTIGVANPSPVTFNVSGLDGLIADVDVRFNNITHSFTDDLGAVIFNPSNVGTILFDGPGDVAIAGVTWTFDDAAGASLANIGSVPTGTYKPGQKQWNDVFTGAPAGPYNTTFLAYNGTAGTGTWQLFIQDFINVDSGSIGSVDLIINTVPNRVPEPSSLALLGMGAFALLRRRRK